MPLEKVGVRAVIEGVANYVRDAARINRSTTGMGTAVGKTGSKFSISTTQALRFGAALVGVQLGISVMSRTIIGLQESTIGAAIAFESSFAGIRKTMSLTEQEFQKLARANRDLAKEIPVTVNELNRIGELAGQLGIQGVANVLEFEETIAKIAVTTDLTADGAALAFAQIANVIQLPQDEIDNLASAVVGLGNTFPAVESKIVALMQRLSGAAKLSGITAGELTGIATAFASVGAPAEAAGSAAQKVLFAMTEAAIKGGRELAIFAGITETTTEQFAALIREDPAKAFTLFVEGLGDIGEDAIAVLDALGLADIRVAREFLKLAGAGDLLRRAIKQGTRDFDENIAANEEAAKRFETTASKIQLLRNAFADIGISAGEALVEGLQPLLEATQEWIDQNGDEFAKDLAESITDAFEAAQDLVRVLDDLSNFGPIELAIALPDASLLAAAAIALALGRPVIAAALVAAAGVVFLAGRGGGGGGPEETLAQLTAEAETLRAGINQFRAEQEALVRGPLLGDIDPAFFAGIEALEKLDARIAALRRAIRLEADRKEPSVLGIARPPFVTFEEDEEGGGRGGFTLPPDPEDAAKALAKLQREAERARDRLQREALSELDTFGALLISALRGRAETELDIELTTIDTEREARRDQHDERIDQINDERDATIEALEDETDATVAALNAQIDALDEEGDADKLAALERDRALAFEEQDVFEADQAIRAFERRQRRDSLRDQIRDVRDAARDRLSAIRDEADAQLEIAQDEFEAEQKLFDAREEAARDTFEMITEDWRLESEARRLILEEENAAIAALLKEQGETWRTAGISFGASLVDGIRSQLDPFLAGILGNVPGTSAATEAAANRRQEIAGRQEAGKQAKAGGAPPVTLDFMRQQLLDLFGVIAEFPHGGFVGSRGERVPIFAEPGELILNRAQQGMLLSPRTVFERGAFEGMLSGATFSGDPRSNARAIRAEFNDLIDDQLGRDAFIAGAGG